MVKIQDIKKELKKLKTDKSRTNYLKSLLAKLKDKKLIKEIKKLIEDSQNLETEIEEPSPRTDLKITEIEAPKYEIREPAPTREVSGLEDRVGNSETKADSRQTQYQVAPPVLYESGTNGESAALKSIREDLGRKGLLHGSTHQEIIEEKREISKYLGNAPTEITNQYFNALEQEETFKKYESNIQPVDVHDILEEDTDKKKYRLKKVEVK